MCKTLTLTGHKTSILTLCNSLKPLYGLYEKASVDCISDSYFNYSETPINTMHKMHILITEKNASKPPSYLYIFTLPYLHIFFLLYLCIFASSYLCMLSLYCCPKIWEMEIKWKCIRDNRAFSHSYSLTPRYALSPWTIIDLRGQCDPLTEF